MPFENIVGKRENAGNQHFLLFAQCFPPIPKCISVFKVHLFCRLQMLLIQTSLKIGRFDSTSLMPGTSSLVSIKIRLDKTCGLIYNLHVPHLERFKCLAVVNLYFLLVSSDRKKSFLWHLL